MWSTKTLRFADIGTGVSLMFGSAALLFAGMVQAAEPGCGPAGAPCGPYGPAANCDGIYAQAGSELRSITGACAPSTYQPAPTVCSPDAVFNGCNTGCDSGCGSWCNLGEPYKLSKDPQFDFGGWIQLGYQNNPDGAFTGNGPAPIFLPPETVQKEWDKLNLNQLYLYSQRVADGSKGVDWGYRFDAVYGVDGNEAQSFGNINPGYWDYLNGFDHGIYEIALPQAYGEIAVENVSVKLGHFYTPIGYEVVTSPDNFFYSRQLTFYNSEPFTHTGALATIKASDKLSLTAGWTLGWDTGFYQFAGGNNALFGFTYALDDKTSIILQNGVGDFGWRGSGHINSLIISRNWTDKFTTVTQADILNTNLVADFTTQGLAEDSVGIINYAFYTINDCLKAGSRMEWYKADGASYHTFTAGVNYKPHANLVVRPEIRRNFAPGDNADLYNQTIYGIDAILKF